MNKREIKFRYSLRLKDTKRYCVWYFTLEEIEQGSFKELFDDRYELLGKDQYIGLKDKNRKEIYEGDIVQWKTVKGKVEFRKGNFTTTLHPNIGRPYWKACEVIGNIYENPKLLKKGKRNK